VKREPSDVMAAQPYVHPLRLLQRLLRHRMGRTGDLRMARRALTSIVATLALASPEFQLR